MWWRAWQSQAIHLLLAIFFICPSIPPLMTPQKSNARRDCREINCRHCNLSIDVVPNFSLQLNPLRGWRKKRTYNVRSDLAAENRIHGNHLCGSESCVIRSGGEAQGVYEMRMRQWMAGGRVENGSLQFGACWSASEERGAWLGRRKMWLIKCGWCGCATGMGAGDYDVRLRWWVGCWLGCPEVDSGTMIKLACGVFLSY